MPQHFVSIVLILRNYKVITELRIVLQENVLRFELTPPVVWFHFIQRN